MPLNGLGRAQAEECGRRLATLVADPVALDAVASPLGRTRETMELLRGAIRLDPHAYALDDRLRELSFGDWEGLTWREVRKRDPVRARERERDKWRYAPPGGGESYAMLMERVRPVIEGIGRDTLMVAHGGVARTVLMLIGGLAEDDAPRIDIWQGRVLVIEGGAYRWV